MSSILFRLLPPARITVSSITRQIPNVARLSTGGIYTPENTEPPIPEYRERSGETTELKRARLLYQSRKRGMTENGLLLSSFAAKFLDNLNEDQLTLYDRLINKPTNDWEIYYWITGNKPTPEEYNHQIMDMLKDHAKNKDHDLRLTQPDLYT
ncbi:hypothetical protein LOTGIDRAFT_238502 [Lottia gigantea]|uniref:Succinate dehydrogenase assembly factor 2, mitochondrial n=1 Tax=Lottia gigantea TaxID=225164 RepID=V4CFL7_LOTGI|nr:hypothetical protein LOTGIDRAFT_238502 [Lottia gigantea]ESP00820.1 hypothetical protein LOTGIDRAFT_238502 [Lottia gigantea]